jgi:hypothetical protein
MKKRNGFITLFMVIMVGSIATGLLFMFSMDSFWSVKSGIGTKYSGQTRALTNACAEIALETIRETNNYVGTKNVALAGNACSFTVTNNGGNNRTLSVSGTIKGVTRKLEIHTSAFNPIGLASWQEVQ